MSWKAVGLSKNGKVFEAPTKLIPRNRSILENLG
jgi:hypothetical protein